MRGSSVPAYTPPPLRGERFAGADHEGGAADSHLPGVHWKIFSGGAHVLPIANVYLLTAHRRLRIVVTTRGRNPAALESGDSRQ